VRHLDNSCYSVDDGSGVSCHNTRVFTALLYANETSWDTQRDGGSLRCHLTSKPVGSVTHEDGCPSSCTGLGCHRDISPIGGRLVVFKSRQLVHEVLPSFRRRFAISCWILQQD